MIDTIILAIFVFLALGPAMLAYKLVVKSNWKQALRYSLWHNGILFAIAFVLLFLKISVPLSGVIGNILVAYILVKVWKKFKVKSVISLMLYMIGFSIALNLLLGMIILNAGLGMMSAAGVSDLVVKGGWAPMIKEILKSVLVRFG